MRTMPFHPFHLISFLSFLRPRWRRWRSYLRRKIKIQSQRKKTSRKLGSRVESVKMMVRWTLSLFSMVDASHRVFAQRSCSTWMVTPSRNVNRSPAVFANFKARLSRHNNWLIFAGVRVLIARVDCPRTCGRINRPRSISHALKESERHPPASKWRSAASLLSDVREMWYGVTWVSLESW